MPSRNKARAVGVAVGAIAMAVAGCAVDVTGSTPQNTDVVGETAFNEFYVGSTPSRLGGPRHTEHAECADGHCIDLRFGAWLCPTADTLNSFGLLVQRLDASDDLINLLDLCGDEAFDGIFFSSAIGPQTLPADPAFAGCDLGGLGRVDVATLHISDAAWAALLEADATSARIFVTLDAHRTTRSTMGGTTVIPGRCGTGGIGMIDQEIFYESICDISHLPPTCHFEPRPTYERRWAVGGFARFFTVAETLGAGPRFSVYNLAGTRELGLLRAGQCPFDLCRDPSVPVGPGPVPAYLPVRWWPPHGTIAGTFAPRDMDGEDVLPTTVGVSVEVGLETYQSIAEINSFTGAPLRILAATGNPFDPATHCIGDGALCSLEVHPPAGSSAWPMGLHFRNFEITSGDTLRWLGDPRRLHLPLVTQDRSGGRFVRRYPNEAAGGFAISLVRWAAPRAIVPANGTTTVHGEVALRSDGTPWATRLEVAYGPSFTHRPLATVPTAAGFDYTIVRGGGGEAFTSDVEIHAYDAGGTYLGYDVIDFVFQGESLGTIGSLAPGDDADGDGLANEDETAAGTAAVLADSDGDALDDAAEVEPDDSLLLGRTRATHPDTDGDGVLDGAEAGDANSDGIPDLLDGDNGTVGVEPVPTLFLVREEWHSEIDLRFDERTAAARTWDIESHVDFVVQYALAVDGNWLVAGDPTAVPELDNDSAQIVARAFPLDAIGTPFLSEISVTTPRCEELGTTGGFVACDLVPIALWGPFGTFDPETSLRVLPDDPDAFVDGEPNVSVSPPPSDSRPATYRIAVYPRDGFVPPDPLLALPRVGMSPIDFETIGGAAHYGGTSAGRSGAPAGSTVSIRSETDGRHLLLSSLRRPAVAGDDAHVAGLSFALCERLEPDSFVEPGWHLDSSSSYCLPLVIDGNGATTDSDPTVDEFEALDLAAFGRLAVLRPGGAVVPATAEVSDEDLLDLLLRRVDEIEVESVLGTSASGPDGPNPLLSGYPGLLAQTVSATDTTRALRRFHRRVVTHISTLDPSFVEGTPRADFDTTPTAPVAAEPVEGTDRLWSTRAGARARAASGASRSADWFRVHVARVDPMRDLEDLVEDCERARASGEDRRGRPLGLTVAERDRVCDVHLRVQVVTPQDVISSGATRGACSRDPADPPDPPRALRGPNLECVEELMRSSTSADTPDGVVFSGVVEFGMLWRPEDRLDATGRHGGVLLRWTGQGATSQILNLANPRATLGLGSIAGCRRFPASDILAGGTSTDTPTAETRYLADASALHPGRYLLRARVGFDADGDRTATAEDLARGRAFSGPPLLWSCGAGFDAASFRGDIGTRGGASSDVSLALPVAVGVMNGVVGSDAAEAAVTAVYPAVSYPLVVPGDAVDASVQEILEFYRDAGAALDVFDARARTDFLADPLLVRVPALPPFAAVLLSFDSPSNCDRLLGIRGTRETAGTSDPTFDGLGVTQFACVLGGWTDNATLASLDEALCPDTRVYAADEDRAAACGTFGAGVCRELAGAFLSGVGPATPASSAVIGRTAGSVGVHELGHVLGLEHVFIGRGEARRCTSPPVDRARCGMESMGSGFCVAGATDGLFGFDGGSHPMLGAALDVSTPCTFLSDRPRFSALYRGIVEQLLADPTRARLVREGALRENSTSQGRNRASGVVACPGGAEFRTIAESTDSLAYLRAQYWLPD